MKQMLKETIKLWIVLIITFALICIIILVPSLIFTYAGIGNWQPIVCVLWLTFCLSLVIAIGIRIGEKESKDKRVK